MKHTAYRADEAQAILGLVGTTQATFNQDASIIAARQLDYVKGRVYESKRPNQIAASLLPRATGTPEWAETIIYTVHDEVGMAKIIANYADDLPRADVKGTEVTARVYTIGDSYGYNIAELTASAALGAQLPDRKGRSARNAIDNKMNQIALKGDSQYKLYGMTNHPNVGLTVLSGENWVLPATTAETVKSDLNAMYNAVLLQSNGVHTPNRMVLPLSLHTAASDKYLANNQGKSALQAFKDDHPQVEVVQSVEFETASSSGGKLAMCGEFNEENAELEVPMPFKQLNGQERNLEIVVPCYARTAGAIFHYPLAFTKAEF